MSGRRVAVMQARPCTGRAEPRRPPAALARAQHGPGGQWTPHRTARTPATRRAASPGPLGPPSLATVECRPEPVRDSRSPPPGPAGRRERIPVTSGDDGGSGVGFGCRLQFGTALEEPRDQLGHQHRPWPVSRPPLPQHPVLSRADEARSRLPRGSAARAGSSVRGVPGGRRVTLVPDHHGPIPAGRPPGRQASRRPWTAPAGCHAGPAYHGYQAATG